MNAINFIKKHGVEKAREIVEGVPESGQPLYFNTVNSIYFFTGYRNRYFVNGVWGNEDDHPSIYEYDIKAVSIADLKRIVESVDLVKSLGGVQEATNKAFDMTMLVVGFNPDKIEQAIADYGQIYGGEHV